MAPNIKVTVGLDSFSNRTNPYKDETTNGGRFVTPNFNSNVPNLGSRPQNVLRNNTVGGASPRLGTLARFSYELDRYSTNALLVIHNDSYSLSDRTVDKVKSTFENYRFQVEVHHNKTGDDIIAVVDEFFRRDFTQYGCAGVVIVSSRYSNGSYVSKGKPFSDEDILKYFNNGAVPTLDGKPKLFIVEENVVNTQHIVDFSKRDLLDLRINRNELNRERSQYPLKVFCEKLDNFSENYNLLDIVLKTIHEVTYAETTIYADINQICLISSMFQSFTKELWLWKNP